MIFHNRYSIEPELNYIILKDDISIESIPFIIFLDIDGVLNIWNDEDVKFEINSNCVNNVNLLAEKYNASIVVSSSWREGLTFERLTQLLYLFNIKANIIGVTPVLSEYTGTENHVDYYDYVQRGNEIQTWMDIVNYTKDFVIIDDTDDMVHLTPHLILTDFYKGFSEDKLMFAIHQTVISDFYKGVNGDRLNLK